MNVKSLNKEFQLFVLQTVIKHLEKLHWSYRIPGSPNFYLQGHACLDRSIGCFRHLVSQRYWRNQSHEESTWSSPLGRKKRRVCFEEGHFPVICEQFVKLMFAPVGLVTWNCWEGIHSLQHKGWYLNDATSSDAIWSNLADFLWVEALKCFQVGEIFHELIRMGGCCLLKILLFHACLRWNWSCKRCASWRVSSRTVWRTPLLIKWLPHVVLNWIVPTRSHKGSSRIVSQNRCDTRHTWSSWQLCMF